MLFLQKYVIGRHFVSFSQPSFIFNPPSVSLILHLYLQHILCTSLTRVRVLRHLMFLYHYRVICCWTSGLCQPMHKSHSILFSTLFLHHEKKSRKQLSINLFVIPTYFTTQFMWILEVVVRSLIKVQYVNRQGHNHIVIKR